MENLKTIAKEMFELTPSEAKELLTILEVEHNIIYHDAVQPVVDVVSEVEVQTSFDVILEDGGAQKLKVVKLVKTLSGLGLREAKELVDSAPSVFAEGIDENQAKEFAKQLSEMGAVVSIK